MNNLKKFATVADYQAATLNYPAVSWITATDGVYFDKTAPTPTVNDKVMMAWTSGDELGADIVLWNGGASIEPELLYVSLTLNDVDVMDGAGQGGTLANYSTPDTDYLAKYELIDDSTITDIFSGDLGGGWGSNVGNVDFLIPSQVTEIQSLPQNVDNVVVEAATPPTISVEWSDFAGDIYVPDNALSVYQTAWNEKASNIFPISEYQGLLPV